MDQHRRSVSMPSFIVTMMGIMTKALEDVKKSKAERTGFRWDCKWCRLWPVNKQEEEVAKTSIQYKGDWWKGRVVDPENTEDLVIVEDERYVEEDEIIGRNWRGRSVGWEWRGRSEGREEILKKRGSAWKGRSVEGDVSDIRRGSEWRGRSVEREESDRRRGREWRGRSVEKEDRNKSRNREWKVKVANKKMESDFDRFVCPDKPWQGRVRSPEREIVVDTSEWGGRVANESWPGAESWRGRVSSPEREILCSNDWDGRVCIH